MKTSYLAFISQMHCPLQSRTYPSDLIVCLTASTLPRQLDFREPFPHQSTSSKYPPEVKAMHFIATHTGIPVRWIYAAHTE